MEIERKYLVKQIPGNLGSFPCRIIEQGYLSTSPVIRIRKDNDLFELTYKSGGLMAREEVNLPLDLFPAASLPKLTYLKAALLLLSLPKSNSRMKSLPCPFPRRTGSARMSLFPGNTTTAI